MASLSGLGPHQTWKELLRVDNDPTRNQGVTSALVRVADGQGTQSALAVSTTAAKVHGAFDTTGAITSAGNITGVTLVGNGLNVGATGQTPSATVNSSGAIVGTSLNVGSGTVTGAQFTGNAATVTNGVYQNSTYFIGTTQNTFNRGSAAQTLSGVNIDGNAGTVAGLAVHASTNNEANKIVRTDGNGYLMAGYINSSNGNEGNASSPARIWGTNGADSVLRSYLTANLDVGIQTGVWTPAFAATSQTFAYAVQAGSYVRVRNHVTCFFRLNFSVGQAATANQLTLTNLPFSIDGTNPVTASAIGYSNFTTTGFTLSFSSSTIVGFVTNVGVSYTVANSGVTTAAGSRLLVGSVSYRTL